MSDRVNIKRNQDQIDALGDKECVALTFFELSIPNHSIVQVLHRGTFQSCQAAIDRSEAPCGYGQIPIIKNAYGGVMEAAKWDAQQAEDKANSNHIDLSSFVMAPSDQSIVN